MVWFLYRYLVHDTYLQLFSVQPFNTIVHVNILFQSHELGLHQDLKNLRAMLSST